MAKRIVYPDKMSADKRKIFKDLLKDEYISFDSDIKYQIYRHHQIAFSCIRSMCYITDDRMFCEEHRPYISIEEDLDDIFSSYKLEQEAFLEWVRFGDMNLTVYKILDKISNTEKLVISLRFGINCSFNHYVEEVARSMSCTAETIRQIEQKALRKLRRLIRKELPKRFAYELKYYGKQQHEEDDD